MSYAEKLPDDLVAAVTAYLEVSWQQPVGTPAIELGIPAQGSVEARILVAADLGGPEPAPGIEEAALEWVDRQVPLQAQAEVALERLAEAWPAGELPVWFGKPWWIELRYPWAEDLEACLAEALEWLESQEK